MSSLFILFIFLVVNRASVGFLIDGTNTHHFDVLQKLVFNTFKLFGSGSAAAIMTYGAEINKDLAMFKLVPFLCHAACS